MAINGKLEQLNSPIFPNSLKNGIRVCFWWLVNVWLFLSEMDGVTRSQIQFRAINSSINPKLSLINQRTNAKRIHERNWIRIQRSLFGFRCLGCAIVLLRRLRPQRQLLLASTIIRSQRWKQWKKMIYTPLSQIIFNSQTTQFFTLSKKIFLNTRDDSLWVSLLLFLGLILAFLRRMSIYGANRPLLYI